MNNFDNHIWIAQDGSHLKMSEMDEASLQAAHTHACAKEFFHHNKAGIFSDLRDQIEEVAEKRKINLVFPDESHPSPKWGTFFCNLRHEKTITLQPVIRKVMDSYKGLEQINPLGDF